ncbi:WecB/TagA/CpsF family glycosyltransferase [Kangiella profundi]|nr:WecB/TagA/CpsF family glycosyltransferase [Kangiella profundi]GGF08524.1 UDP-N-acetyl-D-mannosaminuronic acid transferase [Kangiella profundi]
MTQQPETVLVGSLPISTFEDLDEAIGVISKDNLVLPGFAVAVNAEKVISALKDENLKACLLSATLLYADGISVVKTIKRKDVENSRIPGCELWVELMRKVADSGQSVYLLGASEETNKATADKLREEFGVHNLTRRNGYFEDEQSIVDEVISLKPDIVTVALGSPRQEFLIAKLREVHPSAFYMGVGGSYDVFVGKVKRAPKLFRQLHLEWFYRLLKQPGRLFRQFSLLHYFVLHVAGKL